MVFHSELYNSNRRVLVTGGSGFLAQHLVPELLRRTNWELLVLHRREQSVFPGYRCRRLLECSGSLPEWLAEAKRFAPTHVLHVAAISSPALCESEPELAWDFNAQFSEDLLGVCAAKMRHFLYLSTDLAFEGSESEAPYSADESPAPVTVYAQSKVKFEEVLGPYENSLTLRTSLIVGAPTPFREGVLAWAIAAARKGEHITGFENEWRTPIYAPSLALQLLELSSRELTGRAHALGSPALNRVDFFRHFLEAFSFSPELLRSQPIPRGEGALFRPENVSLSSSLAELGFQSMDCPAIMREAYRDYCWRNCRGA